MHVRKPVKPRGPNPLLQLCRKKIGPHSQRGTLAKLDGRGVIARRMRAIKDELLEALGGVDAISPQKLMILNGLAWRAVRCEMLLSDSLSRGEVAIAAEQLITSHLNGIRRDLEAIGLERWQPPPKTLQQYLEERGAA
jgi:hypothetical protein